VYQRLICQMPPHSVYIEPFLGSGAILRLKRPAEVNIAMDLSATAIEKWRAAAVIVGDGDGDVFTVGNGDASSSNVEIGDAGSRTPSPIPAMTTGAHRHPQRCQLEVTVGDALSFLERPDSSPYLTRGSTLVYLDPPYLRSTRSSSAAIYEHELSDADHRRLLRWCQRAQCMVMLSGYWSELYARHLEGWRLIRFQAMTRGGPAEECLWMNYSEPTALHDYGHLGENFRERERIKRKRNRWVERLRKMPVLERRCLLAAIADTAGNDDGGQDRRK
jgi:DNA adenine methylase